MPVPAEAPVLDGANDTVDVEIRDNGIFVTDHVLDYSDPSQIFITDANGWGGPAIGQMLGRTR